MCKDRQHESTSQTFPPCLKTWFIVRDAKKLDVQGRSFFVCQITAIAEENLGDAKRLGHSALWMVQSWNLWFYLCTASASCCGLQRNQLTNPWGTTSWSFSWICLSEPKRNEYIIKTSSQLKADHSTGQKSIYQQKFANTKNPKPWFNWP